MQLVQKEIISDAIDKKWKELWDGGYTEESCAMLDALDIIKSVPIVNAIPVEWLEEQLVKHPAIQAVLNLWQNEQETNKE